MSNHMSNIHASLMRFCNDFCEDRRGLSFVNFDAHANIDTIPDGDLVGYAGLSVSFRAQTIDLKVMIGLSTEGDTNLFRLNQYIGEMVQMILPTKKIRVLDSESGQDIGWMIVQDNTTVLPVGGSDARPLQYVMLELLTSLNFQALPM